MKHSFVSLSFYITANVINKPILLKSTATVFLKKKIKNAFVLEPLGITKLKRERDQTTPKEVGPFF